jgi:hypothetical protein
MEPDHVQSIPEYLQYEPLDYEPALLTSEMMALEQDIDDEWAGLEPPTDVPEPVTIVLTYPHWKSGTLPLTSRLSRIFPTGRTHRIRFTLVDPETGSEIPAWVVREGRFAYGLDEWYQTHSIPSGAYIELERGEKPGTVLIRLRSRRPRREWVRVVLPVEGQLTFEMRKTLIGCEYDELMIVTEQDSAAVAAVRKRLRGRGLPLSQLIAKVFPELAKLSPQGTVHAATLYSAINVVTRTPPGPLLAELVVSDQYAPVGDNYWILRSNPEEV